MLDRESAAKTDTYCWSRGRIIMAHRFIQYALRAIGIIFILLFALNAGLDGDYVYNIRIPDPYLGKVIPYHVKGIIVYITKEQWNFIYWLRVVLFATGSIFISAAIVEQTNKDSRR